jgi:uncharacterized repeat protein (TIGR03806 family)
MVFSARLGFALGGLAFALGCGSGSAPPSQAAPELDAGARDTASQPDAPPSGLGSRPSNPTCLAPAQVPETGIEGLPLRLSQTGCFDAIDPTRPLPALIPYDINAPLWSDGAAKERWLALPEGTRIQIAADGDLELPPGAVAIKTFALGGRRIETRFFVRSTSGQWSGYTYVWNDAGTDAMVLDEGSHRRPIGDREWQYPTRAECKQCHTDAAGGSLGLELAQLDREMTYPGGRRASQLVTWEQIGLFDRALPMEPVGQRALPGPSDSRASLETRARAYLHANCSNCHRPGVELSGRTDFRFSTLLAETMTCDVEPRDILSASSDARIIAPGSPERSMVVVRMLELGRGRMPEVGSQLVDQEGVSLVSDWIRSLAACP